eukprot:PhM_4_TR3249/c0_g2_i1/m.56898
MPVKKETGGFSYLKKMAPKPKKAIVPVEFPRAATPSISPPRTRPSTSGDDSLALLRQRLEKLRDTKVVPSTSRLSSSSVPPAAVPSPPRRTAPQPRKEPSPAPAAPARSEQPHNYVSPALALPDDWLSSYLESVERSSPPRAATTTPATSSSLCAFAAADAAYSPDEPTATTSGYRPSSMVASPQPVAPIPKKATTTAAPAPRTSYGSATYNPVGGSTSTLSSRKSVPEAELSAKPRSQPTQQQQTQPFKKQLVLKQEEQSSPLWIFFGVVAVVLAVWYGLINPMMATSTQS